MPELNLPESLPRLLLPWYEANHRELPWRSDREPYHVWLSEIMLQQTRVEAVKGYYRRFLEALPDIAALAVCDDDRLMKLWEGLGYYSRARNLKKAAQLIMETHGGMFPENYADIRALPGIGDYTAGAICSICFEQPTPAVDGNVLRVLSRLLASREDILRPAVRRSMSRALEEIYPPGRCGDFTQALMELGATVCTPAGAPDCARCPLKAICKISGSEAWREIPAKSKKQSRRTEQRTVLILRCDGCYALRKRSSTGLLAGLWEFPNVSGQLEVQEALELARSWGCAPRELQQQREKQHIFTHITWEMRGYYLLCGEQSPEFHWVSERDLPEQYSLPTAFRQFYP